MCPCGALSQLIQLRTVFPRRSLMLHCGQQHLVENWAANASHWVPALGAVESVRECDVAPPNGILTFGDVRERLSVLVNKRIQEPHWLSARKKPSVINQRDESCESRGGCRGTTHAADAAVDENLVALSQGRHLAKVGKAGGLWQSPSRIEPPRAVW